MWNYRYRFVTSKHPWAVEIHEQLKSGGGRLHREAICLAWAFIRRWAFTRDNTVQDGWGPQYTTYKVPTCSNAPTEPQEACPRERVGKV